MNFTNDEIIEFGSRLTSLGGRLGYERSSHEYIDLEKFFLDATRFVFADERIARCVDHWLRVYGQLIDSYRLLNLIEQKYPFDSAVLGVFLKILNCKDEKLISFVKKKDILTYRNPGKVKVREADFDHLWLEFNIATHKYVDEKNKNLLNDAYVLEHSQELRDRQKSK